MEKTTLSNASYSRSIMKNWQKGIMFLFVLLSVQLATAQVSIMEGLNSTTLPTGWAQTGNYGGNTLTTCEGSHIWRSNVYSFNPTASMTTSNYTAVSNGTDVTVSFKWKTTEWNVGSGVGASTAVEYSINNGTTWIPVSSPITSNAITSCALYMATIPGASVPAGSNFRFRTVSTFVSGDFYFWIDDIAISQVTANPPACTVLATPANGAANISSSQISWAAAGGVPTGYRLNVGTTPGGTNLLNMFDVGNVLTYNLGVLASGTTYYVTVIAYNANGNATGCTESSFTTCGAVTTLPWVENFDSMTTLGTSFPGCWAAENGAWQTGTAAANTFTDPRSGANYLFNNWGAVNEYMWTIGFNLTAGTSYDFSTFVQGDNGNTWVVDMFVNTAQSSTGATQIGGSYAVPGTGGTYGPQSYVEMRRTFVPTTTGVYYFGVRVNEPTSAPWYLGFDDFRLELTPSCSAPQNLASSNVTFTTATITWGASTSTPADGYEYYYSTSNTPPTGATVASGSTLAGDLSDNLTGLTGDTTYYFWVKAICSGTSESSWGGPASFFTGYCSSLPTSNDGAGITNLQLGTTNFPNGDVTYFYHPTPVVDLPQGINTNVQITFATGYSYNTYIWIDFNDNVTFDASELVFSGESTNVNPSTYNASFIMPAGATLGQHRMRVATSDNAQIPANPCYSGAYGVTLDFNVNIITASCVAPAATATLSPDCTNNQYFVDVNVTNMGNGTPTISNGTTSWPVLATGVTQVGPFTNGSSQTLTLNHGTDSVCNLPLGTFVYNCPPANDTCGTAIAVTAFPYTNTQDATYATNNAGIISGCTTGGGAMNDGVWYTVVGNGLTLTVALTNVVGWDPQLDAYSGTCGTFTCVSSADTGGTNGGEIITITNSTLGTTYYINAGHYSGFGDSPEGLFTINITSASTATPDYVSLQAPIAQTITEGGSVDIYGQVYEGGLTDVVPNIAGQAPGIEAWVGYSTTNTNPNTWTNWIVATHNAAHVSNNDEYTAPLGAGLNSGTYYYATRFRLDNGSFVYGGVDSAGNGNFWNGTTHNSGVLTVQAPPAPANDECSGAIALTAGGVYADQLTDATNVGATDSPNAAPGTCFGYDGGDVWYSVVVPDSGSITIETGNSSTGGTGVDTVITLYSGTSCSDLTQVGCDDDSAATGAYSIEPLTGLLPGSTLFIRVYEYNNDNAGSFGISAYDASLANASFDNAGFSFYPNPVKDVLNLSYTKNISSVSVFNLLGQQVLVNPINATEGQIDMSGFAAGAYLVKVTADNEVKTIKVIKE